MSKQPSPLASVWNAIERILFNARRRAEMAQLHSERMRAIEDRLALLDHGDDSASAKRNALLSVNCGLVSEGKEPLNFRLRGDKTEWTGDLADSKFPAAPKTT
jgi:hypothetical protein